MESNIVRLQLFSLLLAVAAGSALLFMDFPFLLLRQLFVLLAAFSLLAFAFSAGAILRFPGRKHALKAGAIHLYTTLYLVWISVLLLYSGGDVRAFITYAAGVVAVPAIFSLDPLFFFLVCALDALFLRLYPVYSNLPRQEYFMEQLPVLLMLLLLGIVISMFHYLGTLELFLLKKQSEEKERKAELAMRGGNLGYWNWNLQQEQIEVDGRWFGMLGYKEEPGTISFEDFFRLIHPEDRTAVAKALQEYLDGANEDFRLSFRMQEAGGGYRWVYSEGGVTEYDTSHRALSMHGIHQDIQQLRSQQRQLAENEERFKAYTENAPVGVCIVEQGSFQYVNPEAVRIAGYSEEELLGGVGLLRLIHPEDRRKVVSELKYLRRHRQVKGEYLFRIVSRQGTTHWIENRVSVLDWNSMRLLISAVDVSEREAAQERLRTYANFDELTGIYNRRVGLAILRQEMRRAERERNPVSACFLDVNGLKKVNDRAGHATGDELIRDVVRGVRETMRKNDVVCRLGGDEFLVIFPQCDGENAEKIWKRIEEEYTAINQDGSREYSLSVSHGIVQYPGDELHSLEDLLKRADQRMYREKRQVRADDV